MENRTDIDCREVYGLDEYDEYLEQVDLVDFYAINHATGQEIKGFFVWQDTEIKVVDSNLSTADFEPGKIGDQILDIVGDASSNPENERGFFEIENDHEHWDGQWSRA